MAPLNPLHSFYIALAVVSLMCVVLITVILRYTGEKIEKPLSTLAGLFGTILGSIGTFYFGQKDVRHLENEIERKKAEREADMDYCRRDFHDLYEDFQAAQDEIRTLKEQLSGRANP